MNLVRGARAGHGESLEELYARVAPALFAWARLRIPGRFRTRLDAEDLVQEVWIRALTIFDSYDPQRSSFRAWIFRVAKNVMLEVFRKLGRTVGSAESPRAGGPSTRLRRLAGEPDPATSISRRVARDEGIQRFLARTQELNEDDRRLLVCCGLEGLPLAEAATRMSLTRDATAKRWQRLRARLERWDPPGDLLADD